MKLLKKIFILFFYSFIFLFASIVYAQNNPTINSIELDSEEMGNIFIKGKNLVKDVVHNEASVKVLLAEDNNCSSNSLSPLYLEAIKYEGDGSHMLRYFLPDVMEGTVCVFNESNNKLLRKKKFVFYPDEAACVESLKKNGIRFRNANYGIEKESQVLTLDTDKCKDLDLELSLGTVGFSADTTGMGVALEKTQSHNGVCPSNDETFFNDYRGWCYVIEDREKVGILIKEDDKVVNTLRFTPKSNNVDFSFKTRGSSCLEYYPDILSPLNCFVYTEIRTEHSNFSKKDDLIRLMDEYARTRAKELEKKEKDPNYKPHYSSIPFEENGTTVGAYHKSSSDVWGKPWELLKIIGAKHPYNYTYSYVDNSGMNTDSPCYDRTRGKYIPGCYEFLAPIDFDSNGGNLSGVKSRDGHTYIENVREFRFGDYVNFLIRIAISALVIISVVMIMVAGIEYMTVESLFGKSQAKARIKGAVGGLILALASYTILHTLNPKLLDVGAIDNAQSVFSVGGDPNPSNTSTATINGKQCSMVESPWGAPSEKIANFKIKCSSNYSLADIAKSFIGHTTYRFGAKGGKFPSNTTQCLIDGDHTGDKCKNDQGEMQRCGEFCPSDSLCLDCSGFVYEVLKCKGLNPKTYGSVNYFGDGKYGKCKKQKIKITSATKSGDSIILNNGGGGNVYVLKIGDLIGAPNHHIAMYIGNGKFIDSQPGRKNKNTAVKVRDFMKTFNDKKHGAWIQYVVPFDNLKDC